MEQVSVNSFAAGEIAARWQHGFFTTNDGTTLHYIESGTGAPVVLVPGWSQTAEQWKYQIDAFGEHYHVYALDMRGHGESEKPSGGYRIARLAADLNDFIEAKSLEGVRLIAHSMGCSVVWSYLELYGERRLAKLVLTDQMAAIVTNPDWPDQERIDAGSILTADQVIPLDNALIGGESEQTTIAFLSSMFSREYFAQNFDWIMQQNMRFPRRHAADLLFDHAFKDWRGVIGRITLPTLAIGAKASNVPWTALAWIGRTIPGSRTVIFEADEGGSHFMFLENPSKYNSIVSEFLAQT